MSRLLMLSIFLLFLSCQSDKSNKNNFQKGKSVELQEQDKLNILEKIAIKKLTRKFTAVNVDPENFEMYINIYKLEQIVRVWVRERGTDDEFQHLAQYAFCKIAGVLGPKRKEGDLQIPEGLYHINVFNPESKYHLSLGINYPNASDLILSDKEKPGSEIYIHGGCVSQGCVPISDSWITELYIAAERAKGKGQENIPVYMFPYAMIESKFDEFNKIHPDQKEFWTNLKPAFDKIQETKKPLEFSVDEKGRYILK